MIQFNLEEYLENPNRKVITRDGRNVRIICTDKRKDDYPILALCSMDNGSENCYSYLPNGKRYLIEDSSIDLFFAPRKHEGWVNLYKDGNKVAIGTVYPIKSEKDAKMASKDPDYVTTCKITWEE